MIQVKSQFTVIFYKYLSIHIHFLHTHTLSRHYGIWGVTLKFNFISKSTKCVVCTIGEKIPFGNKIQLLIQYVYITNQH